VAIPRPPRYPLLIDPQGQALSWIKKHEAMRLPSFGVTAFTNGRFREQLEFALQEGKALIVAGIEQELDPLIAPVLEKQVCVCVCTRASGCVCFVCGVKGLPLRGDYRVQLW
jgi:dynein heavy chain